LEKINYLKFIVKNSNHEALTSNNSLVANKSLNKNNLLTNFSKIECDYNNYNLFINTNKNANCKTIEFNNFSNYENNYFHLNPVNKFFFKQNFILFFF
jgi:ABC-type siderophore export system fused ATPase/permease subunit